jgi:hypothetical protein
MTRAEQENRNVKLVKRLTQELLEVAQETHPITFCTLLSSILANVVSALPDYYWKEMTQSKACPTPGCSCHIGVDATMKAIDILRREHRVIMKKRAVKN